MTEYSTSIEQKVQSSGFPTKITTSYTNSNLRSETNNIKLMAERVNSMEESITNFTQLIKLIQDNSALQDKEIQKLKKQVKDEAEKAENKFVINFVFHRKI